MAVRDVCDLCTEGHGICVRNNTACQCFAGFGGPSCLNPVVINSTDSSNTSTVNVGAIIAGVLAGVLLTLTIGLVTFFLWRKRRDQRNKPPETPVVPPKTEPVSTLYNFPLSQYDSSVSSASTMTYHLYEELP